MSNKQILMISVAVVFLGTAFFVVRSKGALSNALSSALSSAQIADFSPSSASSEASSPTYRATLLIKNPSGYPVSYSIESFELIANELSLGMLRPIGDWKMNIGGGGQATIYGDIEVSEQTLRALQGQGRTRLLVKGNVSLVARYLWFDSFQEQLWNITKEIEP